MTSSQQQKNVRYSLAIKKELHDNIKKVSRSEGETFLNVLTRFLKIGFYVSNAMRDGSQLKIIDKDGKETNIMFL